MGLDQYLYAKRLSEQAIVTNSEDVVETIDVATWRKHPNLQGFMENIWRTKYEDYVKKLEEENPDSMFTLFNVQKVGLSLEDLNAWEQAVINEELPDTTGFFFGSDSDERYKDYDLETIKKAKELIKEGYLIFYDSWW